MWKRFALAGVLIVALAAASAATAGFMEVRDIASALSLGKTVQFDPNDITAAEAGKPQTILLLGSDKRAAGVAGSGGARSDTIMLVRLNPDADAITVLSIPRDLRVDIPGYGSDKINAAYDRGGPKLTLKTVKQLLGVKINHVVNVNFSGFSDIIDSLGCVYLDIDRRYFNDNPAYADIDLQAGYQKVCGYQALEYARFREEDTDLVRAARQQDVLREAKAQVSSGKLFSQRRKLVRIFGRYSETDKGLRSPRQVLTLLKLALFAANKPVAQVQFPAIIPDNPNDTYLRYRPEKLQAAVQEFLTGTAAVTSKGKSSSDRKRRRARGAQLEDAEQAGEDEVIPIAAKVPYPIYFPRLRSPGSTYVDPPRVYNIRTGGRNHTSYRLVLKKGSFGEYYGVQGTSWKDPPILSEPHETLQFGGRSFDVYYDGNRIHMVAWKSSRAAYWITNTLTRSIKNRDMLAMARSLKTLR
jgi:LCP family protein required for cell wall assembly